MNWKTILKYDEDEPEYVYDGVSMRPSQRRGDDEKEAFINVCYGRRHYF